MQGPPCTNPHTVRRPQATQMNRILDLFSLFLQGHGQICSILSLTKGWRLVCYLPSQTLVGAYWGCFILVDPFLRLGAPMRKKWQFCPLYFISYPLLPFPPGCTKGQSKGRKHWDSFLEGEGREGKLRPGSMYN